LLKACLGRAPGVAGFHVRRHPSSYQGQRRHRPDPARTGCL